MNLNRQKWLWIGVSAAIVIIASVVGMAIANIGPFYDEEHQDPWEELDGQLVFESDIDGDFDIYTMNADGSDIINLTHNEADIYYQDHAPAWSPDGAQIVFISTRENGIEDIYLMNADGTDQRPLLPPGESVNQQPAWSPDGTQIAFSSNRDQRGFSIFVIDLATAEITRLGGSSSWQFMYPTWSPDGTMIAFTADEGGSDDIYVINSDGSDLRRLTENDIAELDPVWSPDSKQIAYEAQHSEFVLDEETQEQVEVKIQQVRLINADGSNAHSLLDIPTSYWDAAWSPDGKTILLAVDYEGMGIAAISTVEPDGANFQYLRINERNSSYNPLWSPDGDTIMFTAQFSPINRQIYVMSLDGVKLRRLGDGQVPSWRPVIPPVVE